MIDIPCPDNISKDGHLPRLWGDKSRYVIAEFGFGTGLNFLNIWEEFEKTASADQQLHYYVIEKHPPSAHDLQKNSGLSHTSRFKKLLSLYPLRIEGWHSIRLSAQITLTLIFDTIDRALPEMQTSVDHWILNQTEPSETLFQNIKRLTPTGTYLKAKPQKIAIIGGGIAGAALAYTLSSRGKAITIFEKNELASGGSGNHRGLCNPRISANKGSEADFYSPAFNLAHRIFADISKTHDIGFRACGSLHLISDENKDKRYRGFKKNWGWHDDHASIISAEESSDAAGVRILQPSLYFEGAGMVSPKKATEYFAQSAKIIVRDIIKLEEVGPTWRIDGEDFDCVILAGSFDVLQFPYTRTLPIEKVRGQVTLIKTTPLYEQLKTNLCYGGYSTVAEGGEAILGSTFQTWIDDPALRPEDDADNIHKLKLVAPQLVDDLTVIGGRASFRSAAKDRAPIIGQIHGVENLYISTAHGSHGILSSIMGAEFLTSKILGDAHILPKSVERFLSPSRFKTS